MLTIALTTCNLSCKSQMSKILWLLWSTPVIISSCNGIVINWYDYQSNLAPWISTKSSINRYLKITKYKFYQKKPNKPSKGHIKSPNLLPAISQCQNNNEKKSNIKYYFDSRFSTKKMVTNSFINISNWSWWTTPNGIKINLIIFWSITACMTPSPLKSTSEPLTQRFSGMWKMVPNSIWSSTSPSIPVKNLKNKNNLQWKIHSAIGLDVPAAPKDKA